MARTRSSAKNNNNINTASTNLPCQNSPKKRILEIFKSRKNATDKNEKSFVNHEISTVTNLEAPTTTSIISKLPAITNILNDSKRKTLEVSNNEIAK
jgi:hypothetical protein